MELLKEYVNKFGMGNVRNDMGEILHSSDRSIVFPNGYVASIVPNRGVNVYKDKTSTIEFKSNKKYSVAACDWDGYFNWKILNQFDDAIDGCIYCDNELEIIIACENIRRLPSCLDDE